jgi:hypothetical protein
MANDFNLENITLAINLKERLSEFDPVYLHIKGLVETLFCDPNPASRIAARIIINKSMTSAGLKLLGGAIIDKQLFLQTAINGERNLLYIMDVPKKLNEKTVKKTYAFSDYSYD